MENKGLQIVQSGERTNTDGKPVSNLILLSLPEVEGVLRSPRRVVKLNESLDLECRPTT
jgi:hypothetical protein